jgi:hypothetical protein
VIWRAIRDAAGNPDRYAIRSDCGRYTIARVVVGGLDRFEGYRGSDLIARGASADVVKQAISAHAGEQVAA